MLITALCSATLSGEESRRPGSKTSHQETLKRTRFHGRRAEKPPNGYLRGLISVTTQTSVIKV